MADDVDDLSHESSDDSFRDHDVNESSESPDDDTDDNATAADIPVQDAAAAVAGRGWEPAGCAAGHITGRVAGRVAGRIAGRVATKSISLILIIIYWLMLFIEWLIN